jgi:Na+-transporting NADH:ubiquinone oxidoreductase subunit F
MEIEVEAEVFSVRKWKCTVRSNHNVATFIKEFKLALPEGETVPFRAGGYIQIECPPHTSPTTRLRHRDEYRGDWDKFDLWRFVSKVDETVTRAYSMANYPERASSCSTSASPRRPALRRGHSPPGIMSPTSSA